MYGREAQLNEGQEQESEGRVGKRGKEAPLTRAPPLGSLFPCFSRQFPDRVPSGRPSPPRLTKDLPVPKTRR
ncbi:hypothetical protein Pmani_013528 [Petrolisthes manimaculis]|uniref:Uncharacterized protein n=1 Tax=Petrolisthes manimaculis TaxID=1843537 RepID=A0AAE1NRG9_9EUCA|nr:hypothetical protein Pmani_033420 [Petrolisthes manimaculis]KAK4315237.1 hypothetical protein Pmani_013528 [Petrolisthes manimaculis]